MFIFIYHFFYRYSNNRDHVQPNEESLAALLRELTVGECMGEFAANIFRARFIPSWREHIWFSKKNFKALFLRWVNFNHDLGLCSRNWISFSSNACFSFR